MQSLVVDSEYLGIEELEKWITEKGQGWQYQVEKYYQQVYPKFIAILGFKSNLVGPWDPDVINSGIAGSEEAIIYLSRELVKKGYRVIVFADPAADSKYRDPVANPRYMPVETYYQIAPKNCITVAWRIYSFDKLLNHTSKIYLWPHDQYNGWFDVRSLSGIFWLSESQRDEYVKFIPEIQNIKSTISGNGIDETQFKEPASYENPYSCIYASNYARGLNYLLGCWSHIKNKFPEATLDIYYGWQTWGLLSADDISKLKQQIEHLKPLDVVEHGKVGHLELAQAMEKTSLWCYPCTAVETYCITAIKAQRAGCLPIVIKSHALKETVHPDAPCIEGSITATDYLYLVLDVMEDIKDNGDWDRKPFIDFASEQTWNNVVDKWDNLIMKGEETNHLYDIEDIPRFEFFDSDEE